MPTRLLRCALAVLAASCVKRVAPSPGADRTVYAGTPVAFGEPANVPEGTEIIWDFGDGTPPAKGPQVRHAFPRAGVYTIVETVKDKDGEVRTARTHIAALRRSVPMAVPGDVRAALVLEHPWSKIPVHREVAGKLALGNFFDDMAHAISEAIGFDALDASAAAANGFDPDKGIAFYTVPQDPEALVIAVGTSDDDKALAAARRLLTYEKGAGRLAGGPFQLTEAKLDDGTPALVGIGASGDRVGVVQRYGYLYLRSAGATEPLLSLKTAAALPPNKGLAAEPRFVAAIKHIGAGDAVFYSRPAEGGEPQQKGRLSGEVGSFAFAVSDKPQLLELRFFAQLRNLSGEQLVAAFKPLKPPPVEREGTDAMVDGLAAKLPAGAASYLRISASPQALWRELARSDAADAARLRDRVQETLGLDVEKDLLPSFTGNVGVAVYLDAFSLIEAILGEQVGSLDRSSFVAVAELSGAGSLQKVLDTAMKSHPTSDRLEVKGATYYRLGEGLQAATKNGVLFLAVGGPPPQPPDEAPPSRRIRKGRPPPRREVTAAELGALGPVLLGGPGRSLGHELYRAGLRGFEVSGQQALWVDIAGVVHSIELAGSEQGGVAGAGARLFAERAAGLRDALMEMRAAPDGLESELYVRFPIKSAQGGR
jgi:hypothetical protein